MSGEPYWFVGLKQLTSGHNDVLSKKNNLICSPGASCSLPIGQWANVIDFPTCSSPLETLLSLNFAIFKEKLRRSVLNLQDFSVL